MSLRRGEKKDLISLRDPPPPETSPGGVRKDGEGGKTFGSVERNGEREPEKDRKRKGGDRLWGGEGNRESGRKRRFFLNFSRSKAYFFPKMCSIVESAGDFS